VSEARDVGLVHRPHHQALTKWPIAVRTWRDGSAENDGHEIDGHENKEQI